MIKIIDCDDHVVDAAVAAAAATGGDVFAAAAFDNDNSDNAIGDDHVD